MRGSLSSALVLAGVVGWVAPACTAPTFRPVSARRAEADGQVVELVRADLRQFVIDVDVRGGAAAPRVDGAWVGSDGGADGAPCARRLAALSVAVAAGSGAERTFALRFDRALLDALD